MFKTNLPSDRSENQGRLTIAESDTLHLINSGAGEKMVAQPRQLARFIFYLFVSRVEVD